jgi:hypothetical protein
VSVAEARTSRPGASPLVASRPEGRSRERMGALPRPAHSMSCAVVPRGGPCRLYPRSASRTRSGLPSRSSPDEHEASLAPCPAHGCGGSTSPARFDIHVEVNHGIRFTP